VANWVNARLIAAGDRLAVLRFSRRARISPSSIFRPDMLVGEGQDLFSERMQRWAPDVFAKKYLFQVRNDDGRDHFLEVSPRFEALCFVLVFGDPYGSYGSYLIRQAHYRCYSVSQQKVDCVQSKHGVVDQADDAADEEDWRFWEASWELMDIAEVHWRRFVLQPAKSARRGRTMPRAGARQSRRSSK
jgi:hypothetical protein